MSNIDLRFAETWPIIEGGTYRRIIGYEDEERKKPLYETGTVMGTARNASGDLQGRLYTYVNGSAPFTVTEGRENFMDWELVSAPSKSAIKGIERIPKKESKATRRR